MKHETIYTGYRDSVSCCSPGNGAGRWQQYSQRTYSRSANRQTGAGVEVVLEQKKDNGWTQLNTGHTDQDGRIKALWPEKAAAPGDYRVIFKTGQYFESKKLDTFFPEIPVEFHISKTNEHYHVPLLLSQYGYSTYRGS